jgi:hypothetical protein
MLVRLEGYSKLDFVSDDGKAIKGHSLFVTLKDPQVEGNAVAKLFVADGIAIPETLTPGGTLDVQFNNKGKVVSVALPTKSPGTVPAKQ